MSMSLVHRAFGLQGYYYVRQDFIAGNIILTVRPESDLVHCLAAGPHWTSHRFGILAYCDHPISSGPIEGTNNKIKTLKRQIYGYRETEFFRLRSMGIHGSEYALFG